MVGARHDVAPVVVQHGDDVARRGTGAGAPLEGDHEGGRRLGRVEHLPGTAHVGERRRRRHDERPLPPVRAREERVRRHAEGVVPTDHVDARQHLARVGRRGGHHAGEHDSGDIQGQEARPKEGGLGGRRGSHGGPPHRWSRARPGRPAARGRQYSSGFLAAAVAVAAVLRQNRDEEPSFRVTTPGTTHRVAVWPVDDARGASTRYRVLAHLPALRDAGIEATVRPPLGLDAPRPLRRLWRLLDLLRDTRGAVDADALLIHRKTYPPAFATALARRGARIVFDLDDALYLPPPGAAGAARYRRNFDATVRLAALVTCGNAELAGRVGDAPRCVVPTPVDCARFSPDALPPPGPATLGWVGHPDNLPDLESLAGPLAELARRRPDLCLVVVSGRPPRLPGVRVEYRPWTLATEVSCFSGITVGLQPLSDTAWTRAKCAFKLLQYMALGIPAVASPVGMTREVAAGGEHAVLATGPGRVGRGARPPAGRRRGAGVAGRRRAPRGRRALLPRGRLAPPRRRPAPRARSPLTRTRA